MDDWVGEWVAKGMDGWVGWVIGRVGVFLCVGGRVRVGERTDERLHS